MHLSGALDYDERDDARDGVSSRPETGVDPIKWAVDGFHAVTNDRCCSSHITGDWYH